MEIEGLDLEQLLAGKGSIPESEKEIEINNELAKIFGAPVHLREKSVNDFSGWIFNLVANYAERDLQTPRPLQTYHQALVEADVVESEATEATRELLDDLDRLEIASNSSRTAGYTFTKHWGWGREEPLYSMEGYRSIPLTGDPI